MEGQALDQALLAHGTPIITIPVGPPSPGATQQMLVGSKRSHPEAALYVTCTCSSSLLSWLAK